MPRKVDYLKRLQRLTVQTEEIATALIKEKDLLEKDLMSKSINLSNVNFENLDLKTLVDLHARLSAVLYEKSKMLNGLAPEH